MPAPRWDAEVRAAVTQAQRNYGVALDPALVHGVIEKETIHGALPITGTVEPNGRRSYGPMQVMDTTAAMHGVTDPTTLVVPSIGIRVGTFELASLVRRFAGDVDRAIAGYNAGAGNAQRNASGRFFNQKYVDDVKGFWKRYGGAVAVGAPAALIVAAAALWWFSRRRRRGGFRVAA